MCASQASQLKPAISRQPCQMSLVGHIEYRDKETSLLKLRWLNMEARGNSARQGIVQYQRNLLLLANVEGRTTRVVRDDNIRAFLFHKGVEICPQSCAGLFQISACHHSHLKLLQSQRTVGTILLKRKLGALPLKLSYHEQVLGGQAVKQSSKHFKTNSGNGHVKSATTSSPARVPTSLSKATTLRETFQPTFQC